MITGSHAVSLSVAKRAEFLSHRRAADPARYIMDAQDGDSIDLLSARQQGSGSLSPGFNSGDPGGSDRSATSMSKNPHTAEANGPPNNDKGAPRAVAVSSVAALRSSILTLVEACLNMDEAAAVAAARDAMAAARRNPVGANAPPADAQAALNLYGTAKHALQLWCRRAAAKPEWAGAGIPRAASARIFSSTSRCRSLSTRSPSHRSATFMPC